MKKLSLLLIILTFNTFSYAETKIVKVATLIDYTPFCFANPIHQTDQTIQIGQDSKDFKGYSWDVLRESYHEMGYTIQLSLLPWSRALYCVENGSYDILFPTGVNKERKKIFNYSKEPINSANFVVYVLEDKEIEFKDLNSLKGLRVARKRGFNYGDKINAATGIKLVDVETVLQGFKMLSGKRVDGFLGYEYNWDYLLKREGLVAQYKKLPPFDSSEEYLVAIKTNPRGNEFLDVFDTGKKRLAASGKLEEIKRKWFGD